MPVGLRSAHPSLATRPVPVYRDAAIKALSEKLDDARERRGRLRDANLTTEVPDREILELRRQLRQGGQLHAGDALGDGRYLLVRSVGRGGFAVVWEAYDTLNEQRVALKVLHSHLSGDPFRRGRFLRGARAMMSLALPTVVQVLEPEQEDEGFCYFVMEFVSGGNLSEAVLARRLDKEDTVPLMLRVCETVAEAHDRGMIHRDIKPANILLDEAYNPKLTDFDLFGAPDTTGGTHTGALGSFLYAAPECLDRPQDATARADVYGLGMTMIFCLSGHELTRSILRAPEPAISRLNCSSRVKAALTRAVAWEPEERFADARAMARALRDAMDEQPPDQPMDPSADDTADRSVSHAPTPDAPASVPAASDIARAQIEKLVDTLLVLFPQAESLGVLVEDSRTGELKVQAERRGRFSSGGVLGVPGAIVQHVLSERRGMLLGETDDENGTGVGTRMGAPLVFEGVFYGVVYVESKHVGFRRQDVDLLKTIANLIALAMYAARVAAQLARRDKLEGDLRVARQIQRSLLPANVPQVVGLDFAVHYETAYQIGGDFYDFIWHDPSHLGLAIGDVAGKAISAALYMARLTTELRSRAAIARTPARLLRRVNQEIAQLGEDGMFATLVYCIYDLESRSLVFTNAGHCVPLLRRGDRVYPLQAECAHTPPLGVTADLGAGEARVQLHSGDMLFMVSDGILEARDARGNDYGLSRLSRRIRTARGSVDDVIKSVLADIDSHTGEQRQQGDDMTIVAMSIDQRRAKRKAAILPGVVPVEGEPTRPMTEDGTALPEYVSEDADNDEE
ncbi:MAG TPA: SpoIIE family protein phosphatase [Kofleriaceae bacterium]